MQITKYITKQDLGDPYDRLADFLELEDIVKLEQLYNGQTIRLKRNTSDIKADYPLLHEILGDRKSRQVIQMLGDIWIYYPTIKRNVGGKIKDLILQENNGYNQVDLSRKYGYTERHIRRILAEAKAPKIDPNQLKIDDIFSV